MSSLADFTPQEVQAFVGAPRAAAPQAAPSPTVDLGPVIAGLEGIVRQLGAVVAQLQSAPRPVINVVSEPLEAQVSFRRNPDGSLKSAQIVETTEKA
jgi:hypothetical protein